MQHTLVLTDLAEVLTHVREQGFEPGEAAFEELTRSILVRHLRSLEPTHCLALFPSALALPGAPLSTARRAAIASLLDPLGIQPRDCADSQAAAALMAHVAARAAERGFRTVLLTRRPSLLHLLAQHVEVCDPVTMRWVSSEEVQARYGVRPELVTDCLALQQATGIGQKGAAKLLQAHGSAEAALEAAAASTSHVMDLLRAGRVPVMEALARSKLASPAVSLSPKDLAMPARARAAHEQISPRWTER